MDERTRPLRNTLEATVWPIGFEAVFAFASLLIGGGAIGAWFLAEPRKESKGR